jgi:UDPglucose 6-dehydrogenase
MHFRSIGIIGLGFVGNAIRSSFDDGITKLVLVDTDPSRGTEKYEDLSACDGVFICVPSPMNSDGSCNSSILESVLEKLKTYEGVIISKCTVPPGKYTELNSQYKNLVYSPEFLTAANAELDYINAKFAIIGGRVKAYVHEAERLIKLSQPNLEKVQHCTIEEAALTKYAINSFLATKVIFMNELQQVAKAAEIDYKKIAWMVPFDERIGLSHMKVPGPDGSFGFGGACFPKDTQALLKYAESLNISMNVLEAAVKKNTLLRLTEPK